MIVAGWENPKSHAQGFGFRLRIRAPSGDAFVYAHVDPTTNTLSAGDLVTKGQWLGTYADPPNGLATKAHLHFEWRDSAGRAQDPTQHAQQVLPGGRIASPFNPQRLHPVLKTIRPHNGMDLVEKK